MKRVPLGAAKCAWNRGRDAARCALRWIPDFVILTGVVVGAGALSMGFRTVGVSLLLIATIVGWNRNWCIESLEELLESCEQSSCNTDHLDATSDTSQGDSDDAH